MKWLLLSSFLLCMLSFSTQPRAKKGTKGRYLAPVQKKHWRMCGRLCRKKLHQMSTSEVNLLLRKFANESYATKLALFSRLFLRTPYKIGPLGEGPHGKYDKDPIFRLDLIDCLTYIETVMALASSSSLSEAMGKTQLIRYKDGNISFATRNHFAFGQWLKQNQAKGWVKVQTTQWAPRVVRKRVMNITQKTWKRGFWKKRVPSSLLPTSFSYSYVPFARVKEMQHRLPAITWAGLVSSAPKKGIVLKHVGFIVRVGKKARLYFRHSSHVVNTIQMPLHRYIQRALKRNRNKPPFKKMVGFVFVSFESPIKEQLPTNKQNQTARQHAWTYLPTGRKRRRKK